MSEGLSQQERLQAIAEKRKRQTEIENKKRQLEDDKRQLSHLKQKSLRERWLLDGAAGSEQDEAKKQLAEDEAKLKGMEENIIRMEQELEVLETGVSATSTKESLTDAATKEEAKTADNKAPAGTVHGNTSSVRYSSSSLSSFSSFTCVLCLSLFLSPSLSLSHPTSLTAYRGQGSAQSAQQPSSGHVRRCLRYDESR
ncbi:unnamed protein product [Oncorhynchus mykiss]|uniref:Paralemmin-1 n=1 Tax=Oncorhynchus mykiss TaxID=8022 RepID=A0A060XN34_ONCMY|nr:unnamed protein product [Oncorhynchus mykiss]